MIRDITIGQYYPVKSRIHSLDPRVKIICTLLFLVSLFVQSSFLGYVIATLFLGMVIYMSKVALRFIPILLEETDKIMKAQIARGADFESGNIIQRAKAMIPILVPLFVSAFRRANDLAMAMEARCYHGGEGRTRMKPLKYNGRDKAAYLITILYAAGVFAVGKFVPFQLWIF